MAIYFVQGNLRSIFYWFHVTVFFLTYGGVRDGDDDHDAHGDDDHDVHGGDDRDDDHDDGDDRGVRDDGGRDDDHGDHDDGGDALHHLEVVHKIFAWWQFLGKTEWIAC